MTLAEGAVASLKDTGVAVAQGLAKTFILQRAGLTAAIELVIMFEEKSMDALNFGQGIHRHNRHVYPTLPCKIAHSSHPRRRELQLDLRRQMAAVRMQDCRLSS